MNEEIVVSVGGNLSGLSTALRGMKGMVSSAADSIKDSFKDAFHHLSAPLSVGAVIAEFEHLSEKVEGIKRQAETLSVSTDFIQQLQAVGKTAGIDAGQIESMMDKLVKGLPAGSDVEEAFFKIADRIAAIQDPAERARAAIENFGKEGVKMIPILSQGSDGIKKMADQFARLSESEIDAIEKAHQAEEEWGSWWDKVFAKWVYGQSLFMKLTKNFYNDLVANIKSGANPFAEALNKTFTQMSDEDVEAKSKKEAQARGARAAAAAQEAQAEYDADLQAFERYQQKKAQSDFRNKNPHQQLASLHLTENDLLIEASMADSAKDFFDAMSDIQDVEDQILATKKKIAQEDKEAAKAADDEHKKKLKAIAEELNARIQARAEELKSDSPTLQDLAQSGYQVFRHNQWEWQQGPFAGVAQQILQLKADVKDAVTWGDSDRRDSDLSKIEDLKKSLPEGVEGSSSNGLPPLGNISVTITAIMNKLEQLYDEATIFDGLKIQTNDPNTGK